MDSNEGDRMPQQKQQQQEFDFERTDQLALIDFNQLPTFRCRDGKTVSTAVLKAVLKVIDSHAGRRGSCFASVETMIKKTSYQTRTIKRALEALRRLRVVREWRVRDGKSWQYHRQVVWSKLAEFVDLDDLKEGTRQKVQRMLREASKNEGATVAPSPPGLRVPLGPFQGATGTVEGATGTISGCHRGHDKVPLNYRSNSPPPPPAADEPLTAPDQWEWAAAAELLNQVGIEQAPAALAGFRRAGGTPQIIELVVDWFDANSDAHGWGPGALYRWLENWYPGQSIKIGWPPPKPAARSAARASEEAAARLAQQTERERQRQAEELRRQEREDRYGSVVDAMSDEQIGELLARVSPFVLKHYRQHGRHPSVVRDALLRAVEQPQDLRAGVWTLKPRTMSEGKEIDQPSTINH